MLSSYRKSSKHPSSSLLPVRWAKTAAEVEPFASEYASAYGASVRDRAYRFAHSVRNTSG
ncbi:MAG: hypothetical protein NZM43_06870 [Saprospiraceae bacterium]|nr:hypothetical protein [Saprospiraceae bacterium]MDW8484031.1 hypothetical protein [Saprospiraceae bacterium]